MITVTVQYGVLEVVKLSSPQNHRTTEEPVGTGGEGDLGLCLAYSGIHLR